MKVPEIPYVSFGSMIGSMDTAMSKGTDVVDISPPLWYPYSGFCGQSFVFIVHLNINY